MTGKRGRKAHVDPPVNFVISVPSSLAAQVELLLYDPITGKPHYGGRSALVQQLLREWVDRMRLTHGGESSMLNSPTTPTTTEPHGNARETPDVE